MNFKSMYASIMNLFLPPPPSVAFKDLIEELRVPKDIVIVQPPVAVEPKTPRKKHDHTRWTQFQFDYVNRKYRAFLAENNRRSPGTKMTQLELVIILNAKMKTNKGRTAMANLWNGRIKREDLPIGTPYFTYDI